MRGIAPTLLPNIGTGLKIEFEDEPSAVIPTIAAIATRAAIKPYSIAVTPHSSFDNLEIRPTMSERRYSGIPSGVTEADIEKLTGRELIAKYNTLEIQAAARAVDQAWRGAKFGFRDKGLR